MTVSVFSKIHCMCEGFSDQCHKPVTAKHRDSSNIMATKRTISTLISLSSIDTISDLNLRITSHIPHIYKLSMLRRWQIVLGLKLTTCCITSRQVREPVSKIKLYIWFTIRYTNQIVSHGECYTIINITIRERPPPSSINLLVNMFYISRTSDLINDDKWCKVNVSSCWYHAMINTKNKHYITELIDVIDQCH